MDAYLNGFHVVAIMKYIAMHIQIQIFVWAYVSYLGYTFGNRISGSYNYA